MSEWRHPFPAERDPWPDHVSVDSLALLKIRSAGGPVIAAEVPGDSKPLVYITGDGCVPAAKIPAGIGISAKYFDTRRPILRHRPYTHHQRQTGYEKYPFHIFLFLL